MVLQPGSRNRVLARVLAMLALVVSIAPWSRAQAATPPGGTQLWVSRYNGSGNGNDLAYALTVSPGGSSVFVTGITAGTKSSSDFGTVAYDTSTGAQLWGMRYNGPG